MCVCASSVKSGLLLTSIGSDHTAWLVMHSSLKSPIDILVPGSSSTT